MCEHGHFSQNFALHGPNSHPPILLGLREIKDNFTHFFRPFDCVRLIQSSLSILCLHSNAGLKTINKLALEKENKILLWIDNTYEQHDIL